MNASTRLVAFLVVLVVLFGASYVVAGAIVPERVVDDWSRSAHETPPTVVVPSSGGATHEHPDGGR